MGVAMVGIFGETGQQTMKNIIAVISLALLLTAQLTSAGVLNETTDYATFHRRSLH
jgi:hypothetical protein